MHNPRIGNLFERADRNCPAFGERPERVRRRGPLEGCAVSPATRVGEVRGDQPDGRVLFRIRIRIIGSSRGEGEGNRGSGFDQLYPLPEHLFGGDIAAKHQQTITGRHQPEVGVAQQEGNLCPFVVYPLVKLKQPIGHNLVHVGQKTGQFHPGRLAGVAHQVERSTVCQVGSQQIGGSERNPRRDMLGQEAVLYGVAGGDAVARGVQATPRSSPPEARTERGIYQGNMEEEHACQR